MELHTTPVSLAEAQARRTALVGELMGIQEQLGDRDRTDWQTGKRVGALDYWQWRRRAMHAKTAKERELVALNQWIKTHRIAGNFAPDDLPAPRMDDLDGLLLGAFLLLKRLRRRLHDATGQHAFSDQEQAYFDALNEYFQHHRIVGQESKKPPPG